MPCSAPNCPKPAAPLDVVDEAAPVPGDAPPLEVVDEHAPEPDDEPEEPNLDHDWVVAAIVHVSLQKAKRAAKYQSYRADAGEKIPALEVYCHLCRMVMEDVRDEPCVAKKNNRHLIGGDQTTRAKRRRSPLPDNAKLLPPVTINRYGIDAVLSGEA